jgi:hypothetical protein
MPIFFPFPRPWSRRNPAACFTTIQERRVATSLRGFTGRGRASLVLRQTASAFRTVPADAPYSPIMAMPAAASPTISLSFRPLPMQTARSLPSSRNSNTVAPENPSGHARNAAIDRPFPRSPSSSGTEETQGHHSLQVSRCIRAWTAYQVSSMVAIPPCGVRENPPFRFWQFRTNAVHCFV